MIHRALVLCLLACFAGSVAGLAQQASTSRSENTPKADKESAKASAYYHYAMGHLYAELAGAYGNRGDYLNRAIDHYKEAMKLDPAAGFLSEELSELYIQSGKLRDAVVEAEDALKKNPDDLNARRILARIYTRLIGDSQQNKVNEEMLKRATEQYQKIVEKEPKDIETWLMLGQLHKIAHNSVEAEKAYQKVLDLQPDHEDAMTGLALVYSDLGDSQKASDLLRRVVEKHPTLRTLTALAATYEQMREYKLAAETLRRAVEMSPRNSDIKRSLAQSLVYSDQLEDAQEIYAELVKEDPKDVLSHLRLSQIYRQQRKFDDARKSSDRAKQLAPDNLEVRYNEVNLLEAEGKTPEAIRALKEILDSTAKQSYNKGEGSNRAVLLERLAILYRSNDQAKEAADAFRQIVELEPELGPRAYAQIIETFRMAKDFARAEQEAETAAGKYPNERIVKIVRASLLAELGKVDEAAAELRTLLDGKNDRDTYHSLAQIYEKAKRYDDMAKALDSAEKLSKAPEEKEAVHFMRGAMYEKMKKFDNSETEFRKVLELNPDNSSALNYLGYMLADRNVRLTEAKDLITKALEHEPDNGAYLDSLGWVYYRLEKLDEAEKYLRRALEKVPRDPTVHDHLGDVYYGQGKVKDAISQWEIALKEWEASSPTERDGSEVAKIQKKLERARVRLAKETSGAQK